MQMTAQPEAEIRIGTRGSELALAQAQEVASKLAQSGAVLPENIEIVAIQTTGDRIVDRPLLEIGGKGLFTLEIEQQLRDKRIDIAVHSTKDMPTKLPEGLELSCYLEREAPGDAFVCLQADRLDALRMGARVGSSSLRRRALLARMRPDLDIVEFRGNVQTRLAKLHAGVADATILAEAGLNRLGMQAKIADRLDTEKFVPAPGQGAICIESRVGDAGAAALLASIHHRDTEIRIRCERAFLASLDGSCRTPIGGLATLRGDSLHFHGMILSPDGKSLHETRMTGRPADAASIGTEAAEKLREQAGDRFFQSWS